MKQTAMVSFITITIAALLAVTPSFARTSVNISDNEDGSSSRVSIKNNVNTNTNNNSSNSKSETHVRIETNGLVKEYHSENGDDINISSEDGSAKVEISNDENNSTHTSQSTGKTEVNVNAEADGEKSETKVVISSDLAKIELPDVDKEKVLVIKDENLKHFHQDLLNFLEFIM